MKFLKWLYPGLRVKRWLLLAFIGVILIGVGAVTASGNWFVFNAELSLRLLLYQLTGINSSVLSGVLIFTFGGLMVIFGLRKVFRSLMVCLLPGTDGELINYLYQHRSLQKGPRIVVLGGGTGLSVLLRGLKRYTSNLTAIVTVTDDGGSSGRLRDELGVLPPGDIRNCLVALADTENLMNEMLSYRFEQGQGLVGHSLGNLLLVAMSERAGGFVPAIQELGKVLALRGQVLPATLSHEVLCAELLDGQIIEGETKITRNGSKGIKRIFLKPGNPQPLQASLEAIARAEAIILGPGSLYTSVIPNLLVDGVVEAIRQARGMKIYICNVMTQPGETDHFTASDHLRVIYEHCGDNLVDYIIVNNQQVRPQQLRKYEAKGAYPVKVDTRGLAGLNVKIVQDSLLDQSDMVRHDPRRLAETVIRLIYRKGLWKR